MKQQTQTPIKAEMRLMKIGSVNSYPIAKMNNVKTYASDLKKNEDRAIRNTNNRYGNYCNTTKLKST